MSSVWLFLSSVAGGIIGGMGMGGGTVLVPLLRLQGLSQLTAQGCNLISFVPMCIVAVILHKKNNMLETKNTLWIVLPAIVTAVIGSLLAHQLRGKVLEVAYAVFLMVTGIYLFAKSVKSKK